MWLFTVVILHVMILQNGSFSVREANRQCTQMIRGVFRGVNSQEISFPGLEALIPGLVRVSVWTVVIRLAKQWQQVRRGSVARWWIRRPRHRRRPRRRQRVTTLTAVVPDHCGDTAESPERCCGGGWSHAVKVRRLLSCFRAPSCCSYSDSLAAAVVWVVAMLMLLTTLCFNDSPVLNLGPVTF